MLCYVQICIKCETMLKFVLMSVELCLICIKFVTVGMEGMRLLNREIDKTIVLRYYVIKNSIP